MALNATTLSAAIKAGLLANGDAQAVDNAALTALCDEVASAVVAHITASAVVTVPVGVAVSVTDPVSGPLVGTTTAPGVGTVS
jgi:hypothetical protein